MLDNDENIDLDALFDSLNIAAGQSDMARGVLNGAVISDANALELHDISLLDVDLYLADATTDQS